MRLRSFVRRRKLTLGGFAAVLVVAGVLQAADANPAQSQNAVLRAYAASEDPGTDPTARVWQRAIPVQVPLSAQAGSYPTGGGSVATLSARALNFGGTLYIRVEWDDATQDNSTVRVENFADAVAVEFPAKSATSVPAICMGQANGGVNIWQWRADSQAGVVDPADYYTNSLVESYPSKEALFYTARAAGNPFANPDLGPVQNLTAQAFGTLATAGTQDVRGEGAWNAGRWAVVFARPLTGAAADQASFTAGVNTDMAFAVWNGSEGDRNGRKSVSPFVTLSVSGAALPAGKGSDWQNIGLAAVVLGLAAALGIGLAAYGYIEGRGK